LAPAALALLLTLRPFLSIAQDGDAIRLDTVGDEMILHGLRATLAEIHVELVLRVRGGTTVAVAFDQDEIVRMGAQPRRVRIEDLHVVGTNHGLAEVEVNVPKDRIWLIVPRAWQADGTTDAAGGTGAAVADCDCAKMKDDRGEAAPAEADGVSCSEAALHPTKSGPEVSAPMATFQIRNRRRTMLISRSCAACRAKNTTLTCGVYDGEACRATTRRQMTT